VFVRSDLRRHEVRRGGRVVLLSTIEFKLLAASRGLTANTQ
jgi:DNA-binding response OmpR family regulator